LFLGEPGLVFYVLSAASIFWLYDKCFLRQELLLEFSHIDIACEPLFHRDQTLTVQP
jgi:hypothetical protein